ncbi:MAG: hypothetical protein PHV49_02895 [Alistipes sp.]|nr:hypothetical protein [Alistipes sp.]
MKTLLLSLIGLGIAGVGSLAAQHEVKSYRIEDDARNFRYIDNGVLRLGVDVSGGGSVFYVAESSTQRNLLNHCDKGRFMQQSYYGMADGSVWDKQPWRWNPVQGGGYRGEPAKILTAKYKKSALELSSRPKHWATGEDIAEMVMTEKIAIRDSVIHIRYKMAYTGQQTHPSTHQEVPAVFVDYALSHLVFYDGTAPWSGAPCTTVIPGWPNESHRSTEHWAAYVDDAGWGIGVYTPGTELMTSYRFEGDRQVGPKAGACSYFAPLRTFSITPGMIFEYDVYITIGSVEQIRARFAAVHRTLKPKL